MNCPFCDHAQTKVVHVAKFDTVNVRTRKCLLLSCGSVFLTDENLRETVSKRLNDNKNQKF